LSCYISLLGASSRVRIELRASRCIVIPAMNDFVKVLFLYRKVVWSLSKADFKSRYLGSVLGIAWAFILPLINLGIMWFALQEGLKAAPASGAPFILWLVSGTFPWAFFSDAILSASNSIVEKPYLVKKVVFQLELLPFIKIIAAALPFVFLSAVMLLLFVFYGFAPDIYWFQIIYYIFCLFALVLSISWLTSSVVVFYRDLGQVVAVFLQLGFWITPIFWSPESVPEKFKFLIFMNPIAYIIMGYRNSLIDKIWFWHSVPQTIYFWSFVLFFGLFGFFVFKKLKPQFADVL